MYQYRYILECERISIRFRDFIGMQAVLMFFVVFFVSVNLVVDVMAVFADPRLRRARST